MQQNEGASEKKSLPLSGRPFTDASPPSPGPSGASRAIPSISLPKGGGAIRGIGEKFAANPATGTGSLTVPIYASPGRAGAGPKLSLTYDSGSGNSPFGFGWSTALPSITRKTDKGLPQYADAQESDIFILSGAEDLAFSLIGAAGQWSRDIIASRTVYSKSYTIHRYRPRVEGLFARIERWSNVLDPVDTFWRSISKDNVTTWFGKTAESRIADPADPSRIFSWLICETSDAKGNVTAYQYKAENSDDVDVSQVCERNRSPASRTAKRYIKRILYGNKTPYLPDLNAPEPAPLPTDWYFELVFDYGEHDLVNPVPQETGQRWNCRADAFSTYRSTFEIRTYRLCRRVLMFHHFDREANVGLNCLVRSTDLVHSPVIPPGDASLPFYSLLLAVNQTSYRRDGAGGYLSQSLPPLEFAYTAAEIDETVHETDTDSLLNIPYGIDGSHYRWADLDGEGLSGILTEQGGNWFYKANLSPVNQQTIHGEEVTLPRFAPVQLVGAKPSMSDLSGGRQRLVDLSGDGVLDLVAYEGPVPGFHERTTDGWEPFAAFPNMPVVDWSSPNLKFIDLTGDGFADLLIAEDHAFSWHASLAAEGFAPAQRTLQAFDEEKGPKLVFADGTETIFLADLSGDGLTDLVRVRNGEISYWPNLGYGRFGAKFTMNESPRFDRSDLFDARRIRLTDIDGSGTADIVYFGSNSVNLYFNQSGNGWGAKRSLRHFPRVESLSMATALDLLGNGTACLVWSSPLAANVRRPMRYIDLMGGQKPHLLVRINNNLGAETMVRYAPSTKFYVADKLSGTPWVTRLPFPVQVVEQVHTYDYVSRSLFVSRYVYHHGFYDGAEREFRGFGRVDQYDTEEFATLANSTDFPQPTNLDAASHVPPVCTKTWFHTGAYLANAKISKYLEQEYYTEGDASSGLAGLSVPQAEAMLLDDTVLPSDIQLPDGSRLAYDPSGEELREACRALRGSVLRQEIYALDGSDEADRPYSVSERNSTIEMLQPRGPNRHGVFFVHVRETIDFHYERKLYTVLGNTLVAPNEPQPARPAADPRVSHTLTLAVDPFGNVLQSAAAAYGRRYIESDLTPADQATQSTSLSTYTESSYTNAVLADDTYRIPLLAQSTTYELIQVQPVSAAPDVTNLFRFDELRGKIQAARDGAHDIPYEDLDAVGLNAGEPYRRLLERKRTVYRPDDMGAAAGDPRALLPLGQLESLALPGTTYKLVFTPGLLSQVFQRGASALVPVPGAVLGSVAADGGGYMDLDGDGHWWVPSERVHYLATAPASPQEKNEALQHFFVPRRTEDAFGNADTIDYDAYDLLGVSLRDAVGNVVSAVNDYRVQAPELVTDANGNRSAVSFDVLGLVAAKAAMGKITETRGDLLTGFSADLTQAHIDAFYNSGNTQTLAPALLGNTTARMVYDVRRFYNSRNASPADPSKWQPVFAATISRETHVADLAPLAQSKMQIGFTYSDGLGREIQQKMQVEPGPVIDGGPVVNPRWVTSGWIIFNNKGKPVRKYEPFFSQLAVSPHQFEFGVQAGVSPILFYDPVERVVATAHPNHTYEKIAFDPWRRENWDVNDTVLVADPKTDPDAGDFFRRLPLADYSPAWFAARSGGGLGPQEQDAAAKTANHANTPPVEYFDALGRAFLVVSDNGADGKFVTHYDLDIQGNQRAMRDALGGRVMTYDYNLTASQIHQASMEASERWILNDATGKPVRAFDSRGHNLRWTYDALRRPIQQFVFGTDLLNSDPRTTAGEVLFEKTEYGEGQVNDQALNARTRVFQHFDPAGVVRNMVHDSVSGQDIAYDFKGNLLRHSRQFVADPTALPNWAAPPALTGDIFVDIAQYDALNRIIASTMPDGSLVQPTYNQANLLETVDVTMPGAGGATPFITNIDYNARGQRILVEYGNQSSTAFTYDPFTFRLAQLVTLRSGFAANQQTVQKLSFTYDPTGNVTHIQDNADIQNVVFFNNQRIEPSAEYTYDAIYRLVQASGREQLGLAAGLHQPPMPTSYNDVPRIHLHHPSDGNAMGTYTENYQYDFVGNFVQFSHRGSNPANPGWRRTYAYAEASLLDAAKVNNRLTRTTISGAAPFNENYTYDLHGNMASMPQLSFMKWNFKDELQITQRQVVNVSDLDGTSHAGERTFYVYDGAGQRVRKSTQTGAGRTIKERLYLHGFEIYREFDSTGKVSLERSTLHVMDDKRRIALVERKLSDAGAPAGALPTTAIRFEYDNHLGTAVLELDETANVITYEEYYPFGSTSYQAGRSLAEVSLKRYRYTGKERDEETGFYYQGARYFAAWLGRWTSCDPTGIKDGLNVYAYVRGNPVKLRDPEGTEGRAADESCTDHHSAALPAAAPAPPPQPAAPTPAPAAQAAERAAAQAGGDPPEGAPPTNVQTSSTASPAVARPGMIEREATATVVIGGSPAGTVATAGVQAAVRYSLSPPFTGRAPVVYGWDVGGTLGGSHGLADSSRGASLGATLRYGRGTNYDQGISTSFGVAFGASISPSVDALGVATYPVTAGVTGVLELAPTHALTLDVNILGSVTAGGGSTTFTGANLLNTGTVGAQAQLGISLGNRLTLGPEALIYGTFGSGAPGASGVSPSISSLRTGAGVGLSRVFGPRDVPSAVGAVQVDGFYEATESRAGSTTTTVRGGGAIINAGVTF